MVEFTPTISSDIEITPEYQEVIDAIERHDPYIFVSGKAGTGKATFRLSARDLFWRGSDGMTY